MKTSTILILAGVAILALFLFMRQSAAAVTTASTATTRPGTAAAPPPANTAGAPPIIARAENAAVSLGSKAVNIGVQSALFIPVTSTKIGVSVAKKVGSEIVHGFGLW